MDPDRIVNYLSLEFLTLFLLLSALQRILWWALLAPFHEFCGIQILPGGTQWWHPPIYLWETRTGNTLFLVGWQDCQIFTGNCEFGEIQLLFGPRFLKNQQKLSQKQMWKCNQMCSLWNQKSFSRKRTRNTSHVSEDSSHFSFLFSNISRHQTIIITWIRTYVNLWKGL